MKTYRINFEAAATLGVKIPAIYRRPAAAREAPPPSPSLKRIAGAVGVSYEEVRSWIRTGRLKARSVNSRWRIRREDLVECLAVEYLPDEIDKLLVNLFPGESGGARGARRSRGC